MSANKLESSLFEYIPKRRVDEVCRYLAQTTNMFTGVMDYQGKMISAYMGGVSCALCRRRRVQGEDASTCQRIDSFAAIEASRRGEAYMYVCPYGLIDICAPIIIDGRYQGAVFVGQVLTDAESMAALPRFNIPIEDDAEGERSMMARYERETARLNTVPFDKLKLYSSLLVYAAKYLSAMGMSALRDASLERRDAELEKMRWELDKTRSAALEDANRLAHLDSLRDFAINSHNPIHQLAVLEDADETQKGMRNLIELLQYLGSDGGGLVSVERETAYLRRYIDLQKSINSAVRVKLRLDGARPDTLIPKLMLIQLADNAFRHAFTSESLDPELTITLNTEGDELLVTASDNGSGMDEDVSTDLMQYMLDPSNAPAKEGWLYLLMRTLRLLYGERWRMDIDTSRGAGTTVTVAIPRTARGGHA